MLKISKAILDRQREYFMNHKQLKPMTMQNIADDIEMHVSTVSRSQRKVYSISRWNDRNERHLIMLPDIWRPRFDDRRD